jgi:REP element-mobilizing transposase RayT
MARPMRIEYEGAVYHVTSRDNERKTFFRNDKDRKTFLDVLKQVNTRYNIICHSIQISLLSGLKILSNTVQNG